MNKFFISLILAAVLSIFLLGAFLFTSIGIFILLTISVIIFVILVFVNLIKKITKTLIIIILVVILLLYINNNLSAKGKKFCENDDDCIIGGRDILSNQCFVGSKSYYDLFVNKKEICSNNLSKVKCIERICTKIETPKDYCTNDDDCICGGKDLAECFVGNKDYFNLYVNKTDICPDFCTGISNNLVTKCVYNKCRLVAKAIIK